MVDESRALHRDFDARRHFTPEKQPIQDARTWLDDLTTAAAPPAAIAASITGGGLDRADEAGLIEMG